MKNDPQFPDDHGGIMGNPPPPQAPLKKNPNRGKERLDFGTFLVAPLAARKFRQKYGIFSEITLRGEGEINF